MRTAFIDNDIAAVWKDPEGGRGVQNLITLLYFGDEISIVAEVGGWTQVELGRGRRGWIREGLRTRTLGVLELAFIDVMQGDACLVTTPNRHRILIDGGENKLAARYLASRFQSESQASGEVVFDAIVVTHGDADHFAGLSILTLDAVNETDEKKNIKVTARRVFHNGLVKRPTSVVERDALGSAIEHSGNLFAPVFDDPREASDPNSHFRRWGQALDELDRRGPTVVQRLDSTCLHEFDFVDDIKVEVLGPTPTTLPDGRSVLPLLGAQPGGAPSASHTINGHSIVLRLTLGNVSVLLAGDLHEAAEDELVNRHNKGDVCLRADVFKVPHHGSDDVSRSFIRAVEPIVSIISAGDEDARRDYLHPRANLLAMLGRAERGADPTIFVTNLAAFDRYVGRAFPAQWRAEAWEPDTTQGTFYARERSAFGIIHVRTDGRRLTVVRRGARADRCEPYRYIVSPDHKAKMENVDRI